jgi:ribosome-associated protein
LNKSKSAASKTYQDTQPLNDLIIDAIQDIKGKKIVKLDLRHIDDAPTDFFIICQGDSTTQIKAIANNIDKRVKDELNTKASHIEGLVGAKWILVDFFTTVVHVFYHETRDFYDLEDLWSDAHTQYYEDIA